MSCSRIRELMEPYLDGELQPADSAACETHLDGCAACRREHEERLRLRATVREQLDVAPPAGLEESILSEVSRLAVGEASAAIGAPARHDTSAGRAADQAAVAWRWPAVIGELVQLLRRPQIAPLAAAAVAVTLVLLVRSIPAPPGDPGTVDSRRTAASFSRPGDVVVLRYHEEPRATGERRSVQMGGLRLEGSL